MKRRICCLLLICIAVSVCLCVSSCKKADTEPVVNDETSTHVPQLLESTIPNETEIPAPRLLESGTLLDNILPIDATQEDQSSSSETSELSKAYLDRITYEIKSINEEENIADVTVQIPNIESVLPDIIDLILKDNSDLEYDKLLELAKAQLTEKLNSGDVESLTYDIKLDIVEKEGKQYFEATDELSELLVGNLKHAFIDLMIQQWEANNENNN